MYQPISYLDIDCRMLFQQHHVIPSKIIIFPHPDIGIECNQAIFTSHVPSHNQSSMDSFHSLICFWPHKIHVFLSCLYINTSKCTSPVTYFHTCIPVTCSLVAHLWNSQWMRIPVLYPPSHIHSVSLWSHGSYSPYPLPKVPRMKNQLDSNFISTHVGFFISVGLFLASFTNM